MRVAIAFDHAGVSLRDTVVSLLELGGHELIDCGTDSQESVDYPLHARTRRRVRLERQGRPGGAGLRVG